MANREACELYIEQRAAEMRAQGIPPKRIGKELRIEVKEIFEVAIPAETIRSRTRRLGGGQMTPPEIIEEFVPTPPDEEIDEQTDKKPPEVTNKSKSKSIFNETNANVEWARWTWNPITGCLHGCDYCYARDIANRFYDKQINFKPHFYPHRLKAPENTPLPKTNNLRDRAVFTVSMGDLFGEWVPMNQIIAVMNAINKNPQWLFLLLTKNPSRMVELIISEKFIYPKNCWLGATIDTQARVSDTLEIMIKLKHQYDNTNIKYISIEPFQEPISLSNYECIDWIIMGGLSKSNSGTCQYCNQPYGYGQPKWEWVESIIVSARKHGIPIYIKPNLMIRPQEYPEYSWD